MASKSTKNEARNTGEATGMLAMIFGKYLPKQLKALYSGQLS